MKFHKIALAIALTAAPLGAFAGGSVDVFYMDQDLDIQGTPNDDGDGYGFRGMAELGQGVSLTALHQDADLDNAPKSNLKETRVGLSYARAMNGFNVGAGLETVTLDSNTGGSGTSDRGYSINVHASMSPIDKVNAYARIAYTDVESRDGIEYEVGASYAITPVVAGFVEYRMLQLENNASPSTDFDLDTLRVGARYTFN